MDNFFYKVNDKEYLVEVTIKKIKNIHFRFVDDVFKISCSRYASKRQILAGLDKFAVKLIKKGSKEKPIGDNYLYLFGQKINISSSGVIKFASHDDIVYKDRDDLNKKLKKFFTSILKERVAYYSNVMKLPLYKVSVRDMKTRFGSNSRHTKSLHFSTVLLHYSFPIIDSVIVHELAHILVYDHSKKFYDVVYKYCPDYDTYRKMLIKGVYA